MVYAWSLQKAGDLLRWRSISFHIDEKITAANELQEIDRAIQVKDFEMISVTSAEEFVAFLKLTRKYIKEEDTYAID